MKLKNGKRRILVVDLDGDNDGQVGYLMGRLKDRLRSQGINVDSWVEETKGRFREVRQAWRRR